MARHIARDREVERAVEEDAFAELQAAERDRSVAELRRKAEPKERRTLVVTAYWRCT